MSPSIELFGKLNNDGEMPKMAFFGLLRFT